MLSIATRPTPPALALREDPPLCALLPDTRLPFDSRAYTTALGNTTAAVLRGDALVLVTGAAGTGKTTLCRGLLAHLDYRTVVSIVMDPCAGIEDLLQTVLRDFCVPLPAGTPLNRHQLVLQLQRFLTSLIPLNARALIVIDEAQHLPPAVLEEIRLLLNCQTEHQTLLQVVLAGQPSTTLTPLLDQRVSQRCHLGSLDATEVGPYIAHRFLGTSGTEAAIAFTPASVRVIGGLSRGTPRVVNLVCDRAVHLARQRGASSVGVALVWRAAHQVIGLAALFPRTRPAHRAALVAILVGAGVSVPAGYWWRSRPAAPATVLAGASAAAAPRSVSASTTVPLRAPEDVRTATLPSIDGVAVTLAGFATDQQAGARRDALVAAGVPAFVNRSARGYTVAAGPYLSEEEARSAHVNATTAPTGTVSASASSETFFQRVVMVRAAGRVSSVIELTGQPRQISTETLSPTAFDVDLGPLAAMPQPQELNGADGAPLIDHVSVRGVAMPDGAAHVRVRFTLWRPARGTVRLSGRRIYLDFDDTTATAGAAPQRAAAAAPRAASAPSAASAPPANPLNNSQVTLQAAAGRFEEILPFLLSASQSSTPDVLNALTGPLDALRSSLRAVSPNPSAARAHELLSSAAELATHAARMDFKGDRAAEARQAAALLAVAQRELGDLR